VSSHTIEGPNSGSENSKSKYSFSVFVLVPKRRMFSEPQGVQGVRFVLVPKRRMFSVPQWSPGGAFRFSTQEANVFRTAMESRGFVSVYYPRGECFPNRTGVQGVRFGLVPKRRMFSVPQWSPGGAFRFSTQEANVFLTAMESRGCVSV
jgi:hypothetical protein